MVTLLLTWYIMVQSSELYPEPVYYTVYETENVIIKYSREVYYDIYGIREETTDIVYDKYRNLTIKQYLYRLRLEDMQDILEDLKGN